MFEAMLPHQPEDYSVMYIDMDSFFASAEQQRRPELRGKPVGVCPFVGEGGCVVACSREAKRYGVKTGMRVREARLLAPDMTFVPDSAVYYRAIHVTLIEILEATPCRVEVRGIDEMYMEVPSYMRTREATEALALHIKQEMRERLGVALTASIGIAANGWQAKMVGSSCKPDGIRAMSQADRGDFYSELKLSACTGIARRMSRQLHSKGLYSTSLLYQASEPALRKFFGVNGTKWYLRLRGFEVDAHAAKLDSSNRKSVGHQTTLMPKPAETIDDLRTILIKMSMKVGFRLRRLDKEARGMSVYLNFVDHSGWGKTLRHVLPFSTQAEMRDYIDQLIAPLQARYQPVKRATIVTFDLVAGGQQRWLDETPVAARRLAATLDTIRDRFGGQAITTAAGLSDKLFPDRPGFGPPDASLLGSGLNGNHESSS